MSYRVINDEVRIFKVSDLNQDTAGVLKQINDGGKPAVVTRHGRFVAMITPLEGHNIEGLLLDAMTNERDLAPQSTMSTDELARALNINLH